MVAVMFERVVHQFVQRLPAGPRFDGHHRSAQRDGLLDRGRRRFLDEDRRGHPAGACELPLKPAHRVHVVDTEQKEQVRRAGSDGQTQPDIVGVDQGDRCDGHVQAARRFDQRHHGPVQRQQQSAEAETGGWWLHHTPLCLIRL